MSKLSTEFKTKVESTIAQFEKTTSIEWVAAIERRASNYSSWRLLLTFSFYALALTFLVETPLELQALQNAQIGQTWENAIHLHPAVLALLATIVFYVLTLIPKVFSLLVPASLKHFEVERTVRELFFKYEISNTVGRTGVLIAVFEFEKSVFVLPDTGLLKALPDSHWKELGGTLARDFNEKNPGESFIQALEVMRIKVAPLFPHSPDQTNELPDHVRGDE